MIDVLLRHLEPLGSAPIAIDPPDDLAATAHAPHAADDPADLIIALRDTLCAARDGAGPLTRRLYGLRDLERAA